MHPILSLLPGVAFTTRSPSDSCTLSCVHFHWVLETFWWPPLSPRQIGRCFISGIKMRTQQMITESKCQTDVPLTQGDLGGTASPSSGNLSVDEPQSWEGWLSVQGFTIDFLSSKTRWNSVWWLSQRWKFGWYINIYKALLGAFPTIMQTQNKAHKKLINVIIFIYQMYKLYPTSFLGGEKQL